MLPPLCVIHPWFILLVRKGFIEEHRDVSIQSDEIFDKSFVGYLQRTSYLHSLLELCYTQPSVWKEMFHHIRTIEMVECSPYLDIHFCLLVHFREQHFSSWSRIKFFIWEWHAKDITELETFFWGRIKRGPCTGAVYMQGERS